ncbi:MAG: hypothetical protein M3N14_05220 [Bacteroidota bacterium]|nr:hypothetical protein [Bacteroidota bacterium]
MKKLNFLIGLLYFGLHFNLVLAQDVVIDPQHLATVIENGAVQSSAESTHNNYLGKINDNLQTINTNVGSLVLAQTMIYEGLSNVNSALKNGMAVKDMALIVSDIISYTNQTLALAKSEPYLFLFTQKFGTEIQGRATRLVTDVSAFILKEGDNVLVDYNSRDQLLRHVRLELQIIDGLAYGAYRAVFWAKQKGIVASLNPYSGFINQDKTFVEDIIRNAKYLKQ